MKSQIECGKRVGACLKALVVTILAALWAISIQSALPNSIASSPTEERSYENGKPQLLSAKPIRGGLDVEKQSPLRSWGSFFS